MHLKKTIGFGLGTITCYLTLGQSTTNNFSSRLTPMISTNGFKAVPMIGGKKSTTAINDTLVDDTSEIAKKVKKIIVDKLGIEENEVTYKASFTNDLGADSLDVVELIMEFEKEFNISIPDEAAEEILTVGEAIEYLKRRINN